MTALTKPLAILLAAQLAGASAALAQADRQCTGPIEAITESLAAARVVGKGRTNFVRSATPQQPDCPSPSVTCRATAYLESGDIVLTRPGPVSGYVCASFVNRKGTATHGWLLATRLVPVGERPSDDIAWTGNWLKSEGRIRITRGKDGALTAEGDATYGAGDKGRVARGAVNTGDFSGKLRRTGDLALVAEASVPTFEAAKDSCAVRLRLAGPFLLAEDNRMCGGLNVSFSGLYVRR